MVKRMDMEAGLQSTPAYSEPGDGAVRQRTLRGETEAYVGLRTDQSGRIADARSALNESDLHRMQLRPACDRFADMSTHHARITGAVDYLADSGRKQRIPIGPCLVENLGRQSIAIIWGGRGQSSVALSAEEVRAATQQGHLVLLD